MINYPLISIITVSFNSEKTIKRTIESVLNQSYDNYEYIIIDGGSKDNTLEIIKSYQDKFIQKGIRYHFISEKDKGIYDAMNKGIALSQGDIVGLINSDDYYSENALQVVADSYLKDDFDVFYSTIALVYSDGKIRIKKAKNKKYMTSRHWNHPTTFIRGDIYRSHQFICHGLYDDYELILRLKKEGYKFVVGNKVIAYFSCEGVTHNNRSFKKMRSLIKERYYIYRKNGYSKFYIFEIILIELLKFILG